MVSSSLRQLLPIWLLSGFLGFFISITPIGNALEENFGLAFLFKLRGTRKAPDNVVLLAIEKSSADYFQLKQQPYKWPRTIHAQAIRRLSRLGAAVIGFDLFFEESRSIEDDRILAQAIGEAGNVVLLQRLTRSTGLENGVSGREDPPIQFISEQLIPLVPILAEEAIALAPFPLPQTPVRLSQAWLFKESCGQKATLPTMMFILLRPTILAKLIELVQQDTSTPSMEKGTFSRGSGGLLKLDSSVQRLRSFFLSDVNSTLKLQLMNSGNVGPVTMSHNESEFFDAMIRLLGGKDSLVVNYYGPPGTISTIPYYTLIEDVPDEDLPDFKGKAVLIGMNHRADLGEKDGFYTTFSDEHGKHISGVEVGATILANLIDGSSINPVHLFVSIAFIFFIAIGVGTTSQILSPIAAGVVGLSLCLAYLSIAYFLFTVKYLWPPLIVPVMVQAPLTFVAVAICNQRQLRRQKKNISDALRCYIPDNIVAELEQDFSHIIDKSDQVHGICLYSDLENYTVLSESCARKDLPQLINRYYEEMFHIVKRYSGLILDIRGDSMLAFWANDENSSTPVNQACQAALAISANFNTHQSFQPHDMPTRIGLHQGSISLGNIGALDHFQYTLTGDTVNTAARIESFNKQLKSRLLVSAAIAENATGIHCRKMGTFLFVGKKNPLTIYELIDINQANCELQKQLNARFSEALTCFERGQWQEAGKLFSECNLLAPDYGPSSWFEQLCLRYKEGMKKADWNGVICLEKK